MKRSIVLACVMFILGSCSNAPLFIEAPFDGHKSEIDVSSLAPAQPRFYSLTVDRKRISFFLVKINGDVQAYFNACEECYPKKAGFRYEEGYIKCRSCNERWPLDSLRVGMGSCYPIPLKGFLKGNNYVISREAVLEGVKFF